jgi:hypothetical protein
MHPPTSVAGSSRRMSPWEQDLLRSPLPRSDDPPAGRGLKPPNRDMNIHIIVLLSAVAWICRKITTDGP